MTILLAMLAAAVTQPRMTERVDPITDERAIYAVFGGPSVNLALGCSNAGDLSTVRVVAHFDKYVGDSRPGILLGGRDVIYRFDQRPPQSVRWYSHQRDVSAESERAKPIDFMLEMKGSSSLHLRETDPYGDQADMSFAYSDPTALIENVLERCGFGPDGQKPKRAR